MEEDYFVFPEYFGVRWRAEILANPARGTTVSCSFGVQKWQIPAVCLQSAGRSRWFSERGLVLGLGYFNLSPLRRGIRAEKVLGNSSSEKF